MSNSTNPFTSYTLSTRYELLEFHLRVVRTTEKAVLLSSGTKSVWLPKSAVKNNEFAQWAGQKLIDAGVWKEGLYEAHSLLRGRCS